MTRELQRSNATRGPWITLARAARLVILATLVALAASCTTTVIPPADPYQPIQVYLLDHGRTPSLVLPRDDGRMVRYAYGDWRWYALGRRDLCTGAQALLIPSEGTLGRQLLSGPHTEESLNEQLGEDFYVRVFPLTVSHHDVERLRAQLDAEHSDGARIQVVESYGMDFVPHPQSYIWFRNSNHVVASWLRELGSETEGFSLLSRWRVEPQPKEMHR